jgi:hypothetical protein
MQAGSADEPGTIEMECAAHRRKTLLGPET